MKTLTIELYKERRSGVIPVLTAVGVLGAAYAFANFFVRGDALLRLPLPPMDVLLTQLYGMTAVLNLFGVVTAACLAYGIEFTGNAIKKMYLLPVRVTRIYLCKFILLTGMLALAVAVQHLALAHIGLTELPQGAFEAGTLMRFALYAFITSMPVLSFMLLAASRCENMWTPLGVGVAGFLSGMALSIPDPGVALAHPFVLMLRPAVALSARPELPVVLISVIETAVFLAAGLWMAGHLRYE